MGQCQAGGPKQGGKISIAVTIDLLGAVGQGP
jgi:hypothetical protein